MPSVTLAESAKLCQDTLLSGVIETITTVDQFYQVLPFLPITGNALAYNRENAMGDVQFLGVGGTITAKNPATFTPVTASLTTIIGDAEVNNLIQTTRSDINDQTAVQVMSKAKNIGRTFRSNLINGDGSGETFEGIIGLCSTSQTIVAGENGSALTLDMLDELLDKVTDKNGDVDYIMMSSRTLRKYYALLRQLGGATIGDVITLPNGRQVPAYRSTPIFRNDFIPETMVQGTNNKTTAIVAGTLDDGSQSIGLSGLTAQGSAGVRVEYIGASHLKDETITRVKFYCGLALFNENGLAMLKGVI